MLVIPCIEFTGGDVARHRAFLDDYAFYIKALLDLHAVTHTDSYLTLALQLDRELHEHYEDKDKGGFFISAASADQGLWVREKPVYDGAEPGANSVTYANLVRLATLTGDPTFQMRSARLLRCFAGLLKEHPVAFSYLLVHAEQSGCELPLRLYQLMPQEQNRADAIKLIATCPEEAKGPLVEELMQLGATSIVTDFMAVHFTATQELYYEVHLKLRTASSLLRVIRVIRTPTEETMYSQSCRIAWPALFDSNKSFRVDGIDADRSGRGMFANVISKKIKEGILPQFPQKETEASPNCAEKSRPDRYRLQSTIQMHAQYRYHGTKLTQTRLSHCQRPSCSLERDSSRGNSPTGRLSRPKTIGGCHVWQRHYSYRGGDDCLAQSSPDS